MSGIVFPSLQLANMKLVTSYRSKCHHSNSYKVIRWHHLIQYLTVVFRPLNWRSAWWIIWMRLPRSLNTTPFSIQARRRRRRRRQLPGERQGRQDCGRGGGGAQLAPLPGLTPVQVRRLPLLRGSHLWRGTNMNTLNKKWRVSSTWLMKKTDFCRDDISHNN